MLCLKPGKESGRVPGLKCCLFCISVPNSLQTVLGWEIQVQDLAYLASNFSPHIWIVRQKERDPARKPRCHPLSLDGAHGKYWSSFGAEGRSSLQGGLAGICSFSRDIRTLSGDAEQQPVPLEAQIALSETERTSCPLKNLQMWRWGQGGNDLLSVCEYKTHLGESLQVNVSCVRQRGVEGLKDEFLGVVGLSQMCTRGAVLRAECWRLRGACAGILNSALLLGQKEFLLILPLSWLLADPFLSWKGWEHRYLLMLRRNNFKFHRELRAPTRSLKRLLFPHVGKNSTSSARPVFEGSSYCLFAWPVLGIGHKSSEFEEL